MSRTLALVLSLVVSSCASGKGPSSKAATNMEDAKLAEAEIGRTLGDFHDAAARSDEPRYFAHFAKGGVFLGTDATERWDAEAFRAYAHPHFEKGKGWVMHATVRHVTIGAQGDVAWFDEALETKNLGPARGSGVMLLDRASGRWQVAQYNLTITVPNERFKEVRDLLASPAKP